MKYRVLYFLSYRGRANAAWSLAGAPVGDWVGDQDPDSACATRLPIPVMAPKRSASTSPELSTDFMSTAADFMALCIGIGIYGICTELSVSVQPNAVRRMKSQDTRLTRHKKALSLCIRCSQPYKTHASPGVGQVVGDGPQPLLLAVRAEVAAVPLRAG